MKNTALFAVTVVGWFGLWWWLGGAPEGIPEYLARLVVLAFLCTPFNIRGNVSTVLGNAVSDGSIYSFFSLYQHAGRDAVTVFGISFYQHAGQDTVTIFGFSLYQHAGWNAVTGLGISLYQHAGRDAKTIFGISLYQYAGRDAGTLIGISVYQRGGISVGSLCALALFQVVKNEKGTRTREFGVGKLTFPESCPPETGFPCS